MRGLHILAAVALLAGFQQVPKPPGAPTALPGSIDGFVVDARSGHGVDGVTVELDEVGPGRGMSRLVTDAAGRFTFDNVPPASYSLRTQRDGYFSGHYGRQIWYEVGALLHVQPGAHTSGVRIPMWKYPVIRGRVTDGAGRAVPGVNVGVLTRTWRGAEGRWDLVAQTSTDTAGNYEWNLAFPGEYTVVATSDDLRYRGELPAPTSIATTFMPNVETIEQAATFEIDLDDDLWGLDLTVARTKPNRPAAVAGWVTGGPPNQWWQLHLYPRSAVFGGVQEPISGTSPTGFFLFDHVPAGDYELVGLPAKREGDPDPSLFVTQTVTLHADEPLSLRLTPQLAGDVTGSLEFSGPGPLPDLGALTIDCRAVGAEFTSRSIEATISVDSVAWKSVPPGDYAIVGSSKDPAWHFEDATVDGASIVDTKFHVPPGGVKDVRVRFASSLGRVSGTLNSQRVIPTVAAFPVDPGLWRYEGDWSRWLVEARISSTVDAQSVGTGALHFTFDALLPGQYYLIAFPKNSYFLDWKALPILERLAKEAVIITVTDSTTLTRTLVVHDIRLW